MEYLLDFKCTVMVWTSAFSSDKNLLGKRSAHASIPNLALVVAQEMGDQGHAAAVAAVGGAAARGGRGAGAIGGRPGGGGGPGSLCTTHSLPWLLGNRNSSATGKGKLSGEQKQMLVLTKKFRVANEAVNFQNQKLIDIYNEVWLAGDFYQESRKGSKNKHHAGNLEKKFLGIMSNLKACKAAVVEAGGQPVPFPLHVYQELPELYKDAIKKEAIM